MRGGNEPKVVLKELPALLMTSIDIKDLEAAAEGLRTDERRKILYLLVKRGSMPRDEIAERLGMKSKASVYRNLDSLKKLGLLATEEREGKTYYHAKTWAPPKWQKLMEKLDLQSEELLYEAYFALKPALNAIVAKIIKEKPGLLPEWEPCQLCETSHGYYEFLMNLFVLTVSRYIASDDLDAHLDLLERRREAKK